MEDDLNLLLAENTRLLKELEALRLKTGTTNTAANTGTTFVSDSLNIIPVLLKYGNFTPKRLSTWNYEEMAAVMQNDPKYKNSVIESFKTLFLFQASISVSADSQPNFAVHEKKAMSFVMASRSFPTILQSIYSNILDIPRAILAFREYIFKDEDPISDDLLLLPLPYPLIETLNKNLSQSHPLLTLMISHPSINPPKVVLEKLLLLSGDALNNSEYKMILKLAAKHCDSKSLYTEIIVPTWSSKNKDIVLMVLDILSSNPDLESFCTDKLLEIKSEL